MIYHDVSATYDHGSPALQRRMARNAELLFWSNLPGRLLAIALVPHLVLVAAQGAWRLARGRLRPFLLGKWDAMRAWGEIKAQRQAARPTGPDGHGAAPLCPGREHGARLAQPPEATQ